MTSISTEVLNTVLANLQEAACFRDNEVQVSALIARRPIKRMKKSFFTKTPVEKFVFVNKSYPKYKKSYLKRAGEHIFKHTAFLKTEEGLVGACFNKQIKKVIND